jgi:hypothetical protein
MPALFKPGIAAQNRRAALAAPALKDILAPCGGLLSGDTSMKKTFRSLLAMLALVALPAFAFHCPADMKKIDEALPKAKLTDAQMAEVKKLRADGEKLHKEGKHQESVDTLAKAMKIMGM